MSKFFSNVHCKIEYTTTIEANSSSTLAVQKTKYPCPTLVELAALAGVSHDLIRVIRIQTEDFLLGPIICYLDYSGDARRPVYRLFKDNLYDYTCLDIKDRKAFNCFLKAVKNDAKLHNATIIALHGVIFSNYLPKSPFCLATTTLFFDASVSGQDWDWILKKKSLRRHWNRARKQSGFRVEHAKGSVTREKLLVLAQLHKERFTFDGLESAFVSSERLDEYALDTENRLITTIYFGEEPVCCHYGMIFGDTLLWHTPVINIKYLDYSPLELLIYATAQWCDVNGIIKLDLGQGTEEYKERFGNRQRDSFSILLPLSTQGLLNYAYSHLYHSRKLSVFLYINRLRKTAKKAISNIKSYYRAIRTSILWFDMVPQGDLMAASLFSDNFVLIRHFETFVDFCREHNYQIKRLHYDRFRAGDVFFALHGPSSVFSSGWGTWSNSFYVSEIRRTLPVAGLLLYNFQTAPDHRMRGYYSMLLRMITLSFPNETISIFAAISNTPSISGIKKAGFESAKLINYFSAKR